MAHILELVLIAGGLTAAVAVSVVCGLGVLVWLAGGKSLPRKRPGV